MKPKIYITKSLPDEIVLELLENFEISVWEEEDFAILEHAEEKADGNSIKTDYLEM
jgi:lactate dehydrogenase-like 2-hydroxyacid dehydrogenase